jgi:type IV pilus assembly protein PilC
LVARQAAATARLPGKLQAVLELTEVSTTKSSFADPQLLRCDPTVLALNTRHLAVMLAAGVPLVQALDSLKHGSDPRLCHCFEEVLGDVLKGQSLSKCLSRFPRIFPRTYLTMVKIGESTGSLIESLNVLASWLERDQQTRMKVSKALVYPSFVLGLTLLLTLVVIWKVLPPFMTMFRQANLELPLPTRILMLLMDGAANPLVWVLTGVGCYGYFELMRRRWSSEEGASEIFSRWTRLPILGWMLRCAGLARWTLAMSALLESGVDLQTAVRLSGQAAGDPRLALDTRQATKKIQGGSDLSEHLLTRDDLYPRCLVQLLQAGEESSRVPAMLKRAAIIYSEELEFQIDLLGTAIEPLLLSVVAFIVGFVLISIFLPMYALADKLG